MSAQDIMLGARVLHIRELKTEIAKLKAENLSLRSELGALKSHFDMALLAAEDLKSLPEGGTLEIWDGWNLILGAKKEADDRDALIGQARRLLEERPLDRVWIVFDGPRESSSSEGRLRMSYTGGTGAHRADRFITDFVRMAAYLGLAGRLRVRTNDKAFDAEVRRLVSV